MSREVADRIAAGMVAAWRRRVRHVPGHVIRSVDGVIVCLSNLAEDLNAALIVREPRDAVRALSRAGRLFEAHAQPFGVEVEAGRHRAIDGAMRSLGLVVAVARPAMAIAVEDLAPPKPPGGVEIHRVSTSEEVAAVADLEVRVFETRRAVAERFIAPSMLEVAGARLYLARADGEPVGFAWTSVHDGAVGVFGVATLPEHRRRGIGTAVTSFAIHDAPRLDLAWLQPTEAGRPLYGSMGFARASDWEVWVRPEGGSDRGP
jgi:ribosomal protein S18 acetylase RimI-like enzyme